MIQGLFTLKTEKRYLVSLLNKEVGSVTKRDPYIRLDLER